MKTRRVIFKLSYISFLLTSKKKRLNAWMKLFGEPSYSLENNYKYYWHWSLTNSSSWMVCSAPYARSFTKLLSISNWAQGWTEAWSRAYDRECKKCIEVKINPKLEYKTKSIEDTSESLKPLSSQKSLSSLTTRLFNLSWPQKFLMNKSQTFLLSHYDYLQKILHCL